ARNGRLPGTGWTHGDLGLPLELGCAAERINDWYDRGNILHACGVNAAQARRNSRTNTHSHHTFSKFESQPRWLTLYYSFSAGDIKAQSAGSTCRQGG